MTVIKCVILNKRETVIRDKDVTVIVMIERENERENEIERVGGEDSAPFTPTHSHSKTTPNTSFAFLINSTICHLRYYISDYATYISVDLFLSLIFHNYLT